MKSTVLALLALAALAACNTVEGAGRDVQSGGKAITRGAEEVQKKIP
jgi:predicted small secreted protein